MKLKGIILAIFLRYNMPFIANLSYWLSKLFHPSLIDPLQGWTTQRSGKSGWLSSSPQVVHFTERLDFTVRSLRSSGECHKEQEVEAASFLRPGPGNWHSIPSSAFYRFTGMRGGSIDFTSPWEDCQRIWESCLKNCPKFSVSSICC